MAEIVRVKMTTGECRDLELVSGNGNISIDTSVGRKGVNRPADVRVIQESLNGFPAGPSAKRDLSFLDRAEHTRGGVVLRSLRPERLGQSAQLVRQESAAKCPPGASPVLDKTATIPV
jgi:hypothetical protein